LTRVTNLMLSCALVDFDDRGDGPDGLCPALRHVKDWCLGVGREPRRHDLYFPDRTVEAVSAGSKPMEANVYCWGANYLDLDEFLAAVAAAPWCLPEGVQVFAMGQEDDRFTMYSLRADRTWSVLAADDPDPRGSPPMPPPARETATPDELATRLLGLMAFGCRLEARDGHIWIEPFTAGDDEGDDAPALVRILKSAGIGLNNKIYGGVLQALDTVDEALALAGHHSRLRDAGTAGDTWGYFLGVPGADRGRINWGLPGRGGIY
jgi:hypothetical protein